MAKKEEGPKVVLEREYNVPLRREFQKSPRWKKTKKAVKALKEFLQKHMKSDDVKLGRYLNEELWKHGMKNPPHHVKVIAKKEDNGVVTAELEGAPVEKPKEEEKGKEPVKGEPKPEAKKEASKAEEKKAAPEAKEKVVEEKKEEPKKPQQKEKAEKEEKPAPDVKEVEKLAKDIVRKESLK